jgi:hypothetical protein
MAIRDDFTAGEVLAAADLNDTFGSKIPYAYGTATPSTTVDGFVWYDENETPPAPKFWDGSAFQLVSAPSGLVHIATESFSAVSSVSLNDVFTSAYENYQLSGSLTTCSDAGIAILSRFLTSGTATTANYFTQRFTQFSSTVNGQQNAFGTDDFELAWYASSSFPEYSGFNATIQRPQKPLPTIFNANGIFKNATPERVQYLTAGFHEGTNSFDGITFFTTSGTISGTIRVYGYANS